MSVELDGVCRVAKRDARLKVHEGASDCFALIA